LVGITDQMSFSFQYDAAVWTQVVLNRWERPFSARDRLLVEFLQPHLAQVHKNAVLLSDSHQRTESLTGAFASIHQGLVVLDSKGQALWMTKSSLQWLSLYFVEPVGEQRLPERLYRWVQTQRTRNQKPPQSLPEPLAITHAHARLIIRFFEDTRGRQFLLLKEEKMGVCPSAFVRLGLTPREGEVLYWICQGKNNPEIATVEGISLRTVHKDVEHILAKLKVESRAAAMVTALQTLDES